MKRLITDNPQGNMERLLNFSYAKEGRVFLRDGNGEGDIDLSDYISQEAKKKNCNITPDEVMDGVCIGCGCALSVLVYVAIQAAELRERLKMYEDKEESREK